MHHRLPQVGGMHCRTRVLTLCGESCSFLGPKDCCRLSSTQKSWVNTGGEDPLWQTFCLDDFGVTRKLGIHGQAFQTFKWVLDPIPKAVSCQACDSWQQAGHMLKSCGVQATTTA